MNLANKLTIFRILLVPLIIIIPFFNLSGVIFEIPITYIIINIIFCIAAFTDKLDGDIARKRNQVTTFGKFLDPIADKILVLSVLILLVEFGKIPAWIPIIVLFREFVVSGYRLIVVEKGGKVIAASIWGKVKTVTQMVAIILTLIDTYNFAEFKSPINILASSFMIVSIIATIFSGWDYIKDWRNI